MSTRVAVEEIEVTTGEKVLAVVLAIFIWIGAVWSYVRIDDIGAEDGAVTVQATQSERAAIEAHRATTRELLEAKRGARVARRKVEFTREAYRTALDAGQPSAARDGG